MRGRIGPALGHSYPRPPCAWHWWTHISSPPCFWAQFGTEGGSQSLTDWSLAYLLNKIIFKLSRSWFKFKFFKVHWKCITFGADKRWPVLTIKSNLEYESNGESMQRKFVLGEDDDFRVYILIGPKTVLWTERWILASKVFPAFSKSRWYMSSPIKD